MHCAKRQPQCSRLVAASLALLVCALILLLLSESDASAGGGTQKARVGWVNAVKYQSVTLDKTRQLAPDGDPWGAGHLQELRAGDELRATLLGEVWFSVNRGKQGAYCGIRPRHGLARVRVTPNPKVLLDFEAGTDDCVTSRTGKTKTIKTVLGTTVTTKDPIF